MLDRFELLATITNDCLIDWDLVTDTVWRFEGPHGFLGHSSDSLRHYRKWWAENVHSEDKAVVLASFHQAMEQGQEIWSHAYRFLGAAGEVHPIFEKGKIIRDENGKVVRYIGALRDMTEQKAIEEQLQLSEQRAQAASLAKNHFIASMSHEFRTPLNAVIGFSQLLMEDNAEIPALESRQRDYLQRILTAGKHLLGLVSEILELSAIEQGKIRVSREKIDVTALLDECVASHDLKLRDCRLTLERKDKEPVFINADRKHMIQVFTNLLANAIKFTREGGKIEIDVTQSDSETVFFVGDNGIGIAPTDQGRIFMDFEQLESQRFKMGSAAGLGLGLSICRKLVELHGGRIWVESREGCGSRFYFSIPHVV